MSETLPKDPEQLARACVDVLWAQDRASQTLGMVLESVKQGGAQVSMVIGDKMVNGHGMAHGGFIFILADSAFAFASNSRNNFAVAQFCNVAFLRPAMQGDRLTATAEECVRSGRTGIYDVSVSNQTGEPIAEFRGHSRLIAGTFFRVPDEVN